jgi:hypothetical protein
MTRLPLLLAAVLSLLCLRPAPGRADPPHRYALAMMHFNIQYVAGGLVGLVNMPDPAWDLSAEQVEDAIITESLEPVLDLFLAHPSWSTYIEMQGYMLEVIAARHPGVLDKLKQLTSAGGIEVASFHYSDQLFIAHSPEDWQRSVALTQAAFQKYGIPLSTTVFCQEGQSGIGMAAAMKDHGYKTLVWPKNLLDYQHTGDPKLLYRFGEVAMIPSRALHSDDGQGHVVDVQWTFVDDGELLATGGIDPYFPTIYKKDPKAVADYEAQLSMLEAMGYQISTVSKYAADLAGVVPAADPPPLLDGTWQPNSTDGALKWLGGQGVWPFERDNDVRTLATLAHRELLVAQTLAAQAGVDASADLAAGFRLLALGEVSDASGINPIRGEVEYGMAHFTETLRIARGVIAQARTALHKDDPAQQALIDTAAGRVTWGTPPAAPASVEHGPIELQLAPGDRPASVSWQRVDDNHYIATVHFGTGTENTVAVTLPGQLAAIEYTPALTTTPVALSRGDFTFAHYELPLSDGLIGLGGGLYAIKDLGRVHLAAHIERTVGDVSFTDQTLSATEEATWVFHLLRGDATAAAAVAHNLNVQPAVWR